MTTPELIREAWASTVWKDESITSITPNIFDHEITLESGNDIGDLYYQQDIAFFTYVVNRRQKLEMMGEISRWYPIEISFWVAQFAKGQNQQNAVVDAFVAVDIAMFSLLGDNWGGTVKFFTMQDGPIKISSGRIGDVPVWKGSYTYTGYEKAQIL